MHVVLWLKLRAPMMGCCNLLLSAGRLLTNRPLTLSSPLLLYSLLTLGSKLFVCISCTSGLVVRTHIEAFTIMSPRKLLYS